MLARRIIPCLDVKNGRNVRGVKFSADKDAGDPIALARRYDAEGADELVFYDITASAEKRDIVGKLVRRVSEEVFIPFTVGGGVRTYWDIRTIIEGGAEKRRSIRRPYTRLKLLLRGPKVLDLRQLWDQLTQFDDRIPIK